jgi:hypothetical protein
MGTARRQYPDEFRREALELLVSSGRPLSQSAGELAIPTARLGATKAAGAKRDRRGAPTRRRRSSAETQSAAASRPRSTCRHAGRSNAAARSSLAFRSRRPSRVIRSKSGLSIPSAYASVMVRNFNSTNGRPPRRVAAGGRGLATPSSRGKKRRRRDYGR